MSLPSHHIDINQPDFIKHLAELDKNKPVLVYCAIGGRSSKAMAIMKKEGFKEVYNLEGGMTAWKDAGMPITKK